MVEPARVLGALADGCEMSGRILAERFKVSRARIGQVIAALRQQGYSIRSVPGHGYQWRGPFDLLAPAELGGDLRDGWSLCATWEVDSTSDRLVSKRAHREILFAEHQTAGRGRVGRHWLSPPGGLYFSVARWFRGLAHGPQRLSPWVASSLTIALRAAGAANITAKWPNDILAHGRKVGGILIEITGDPYGDCHLCVGVGVNWYRPDVGDQSVAGLTETLQAGIRRNDIGARLAAAVAAAVDAYPTVSGEAAIQAWRSVDGSYGKMVYCRHGGSQIAGVADGIDSDGALRLITDEGVQRVAAGEVQISPDE